MIKVVAGHRLTRRVSCPPGGGGARALDDRSCSRGLPAQPGHQGERVGVAPDELQHVPPQLLRVAVLQLLWAEGGRAIQRLQRLEGGEGTGHGGDGGGGG